MGFLSQKLYNVGKAPRWQKLTPPPNMPIWPHLLSCQSKATFGSLCFLSAESKPTDMQIGHMLPQKCHVSARSPSLAPPTRALPSQKTQQHIGHCTFDLLASFYVALIQWPPPVSKMRQTAPSVIPQAVILLLSISHISRQLITPRLGPAGTLWQPITKASSHDMTALVFALLLSPSYAHCFSALS